MSDQHFSAHVAFSRPTQLTLAPGAHCLSPEDPPPDGKPFFLPPEEIGFGYPLTTWMGDRPIASRFFTPRQARALGYSLLFRDPLQVALDARLLPGRAQGLVRIDIGAAPVTRGQKEELLELEEHLPEVELGLVVIPEECEHTIDWFGRIRIKGEILQPEPRPFDENLELVLRLGNDERAVFAEATRTIIGEKFQERLPFDLELDPLGHQPTVLWITYREKEVKRCKQCGEYRERLGPNNGLCFGCA